MFKGIDCLIVHRKPCVSVHAGTSNKASASRKCQVRRITLNERSTHIAFNISFSDSVEVKLKSSWMGLTSSLRIGGCSSLERLVFCDKAGHGKARAWVDGEDETLGSLLRGGPGVEVSG